jgi:hypothetical protein
MITTEKAKRIVRNITRASYQFDVVVPERKPFRPYARHQRNESRLYSHFFHLKNERHGIAVRPFQLRHALEIHAVD